MRSKTYISAALLVFATLLPGCPGRTRMPVSEQELLQETLQHRSRQLAVSMYWGPFFRDARYLLLSDQPPGDVDLMLNPKGERMHPGEPLGIIPAGTTVRIADIQFATATNTTTRSLITPRFFTWVLIEVPELDKLGVLVVRDEPDSHQGFLDILSRHLTTENVALQLAGFPEEIRAAVAEKRLVTEMEVEAVRMAWGIPIQVTRNYEEGVRVDQWRFEGGRSLILRDGVLVSWEE